MQGVSAFLRDSRALGVGSIVTAVLASLAGIYGFLCKKGGFWRQLPDCIVIR